MRQDRGPEGPAAARQRVVIQLMTRLVLAQATLAAAIGLFYSRRHVPSVVVTQSDRASRLAERVSASVTRFSTAVAVTLAKSELPTAIDFALSRYGGSSSSRIKVGGPLSSFVHAVSPGAFRGE